MPKPSDMPPRGNPPALPTSTPSQDAAAERLLEVHAYTRPSLLRLAPAPEPTPVEAPRRDLPIAI